jgi:hypothetical protein
MKQLLTDDQVRRATELWSSGQTLDELCRAIGCNRDVLVERRRDQLAHLPKRTRGVGPKNIGAPDPTPDEIVERCATIRATWSEVERLNRRAGPGAPVDSWVGPRDGGRGATFKMPRRTW